MDDKTLEALKGSITKWENIVAGTGVDHSVDNCPLCLMFHPDFTDGDTDDNPCDGCPVKVATGYGYCENSLYEKWLDVTDDIWPRKASTPEAIQAAQAELDFLRSLLPKEEPTV